MKSANVSYIVPVFNGERYLAEALESILAQTMPAREVIVVNDGSTDNTREILAAYGERLKVIEQANAGQSAARNHGARLAAGTFIAFLDADDLIHPRKLERQLEQLQANAALELCDAYASNFWSPEIPQEERAAAPLEWWTHQEKPIADHISTWLVRRSLFDRVGGFDEGRRFAEDCGWHHRAKTCGAQAATLPLVLARRRLHANNLTRLHYREHVESTLDFIGERARRRSS